MAAVEREHSHLFVRFKRDVRYWHLADVADILPLLRALS